MYATDSVGGCHGVLPEVFLLRIKLGEVRVVNGTGKRFGHILPVFELELKSVFIEPSLLYCAERGVRQPHLREHGRLAVDVAGNELERVFPECAVTIRLNVDSFYRFAF